MLNLLSAEFYKWKKSKSFIVCASIAILLVILIYFSFSVALQIQNGEVENGTNGVTVSEDADAAQFQIMDVMGEVTASGMMLIFTGIFSCIWVVSEYNHGAIKNIAGKGYSGRTVFAAKWISSLLTAVVMQILIIASMVLSGYIAFGKAGMGESFWTTLFSYSGIQLLLTVAFTSVIVMFCEFVRSTAVGISICMGVLMFSTTITSALDLIFMKFQLDFRTKSYWIMDLIADCPVGSIEMDFVGRVISVAVMWSAISMVLGMTHFQRADIK